MSSHFIWVCPSRAIWVWKNLHLHTSGWTHSEVIWATSCREVKPELRKLSLYWLIFMAVSQSSTELKVLKSGMDLSNSGWEGLQGREREREGEWGRVSERRTGVSGDIVQLLWCNIKQGGFREEESNCGSGACVGVGVRGRKCACVCVYSLKTGFWKVFWPDQ